MKLILTIFIIIWLFFSYKNIATSLSEATFIILNKYSYVYSIFILIVYFYIFGYVFRLLRFLTLKHNEIDLKILQYNFEVLHLNYYFITILLITIFFTKKLIFIFFRYHFYKIYFFHYDKLYKVYNFLLKLYRIKFFSLKIFNISVITFLVFLFYFYILVKGIIK